MIGVYTDLKVKTLLSGLRMLYNLPNLAVSDSLTASAALERHLSGLDFAAKVLGVEVIHGINDLVRFLGGSGELEDESKVVATDSFSRYQSFFQDQQNVLAYEAQRLQEYTMLTERRSRDVYETVKRANRFLLVCATFLTATLVLSIASAVSDVDWKLPAITAGVSLAQFLGAFFTQPTSDLQRNLTNLAAFRMILESQPEDGVRAVPPDDAAHAPRAAHRARVDGGGPPARRARAGTRGDPGPRQIRLPEPARPRLRRCRGTGRRGRARAGRDGGGTAGRVERGRRGAALAAGPRELLRQGRGVARVRRVRRVLRQPGRPLRLREAALDERADPLLQHGARRRADLPLLPGDRRDQPRAALGSSRFSTDQSAL